MDEAGRPHLSPDEALPTPPSLVALRKKVKAMLPLVDLPELLLEVDAWTGFTSAFTHVGTGEARVADLGLSVIAVLVAEACNVGLVPVASRGVAALTRERLSHVDQNYVRAETIAAANALLVEYQVGTALAQAWGGGHLASADGLRFVVPVRTVNAGRTPRTMSPAAPTTVPLRNVFITAPCGICGRPLPPGHRRWCSDACRQAAWRRRHQPVADLPELPPASSKRAGTVYACPDCDTRLLGTQYCEGCHTFMTRVGHGGHRPSCLLTEQRIA